MLVASITFGKPLAEVPLPPGAIPAPPTRHGCAVGVVSGNTAGTWHECTAARKTLQPAGFTAGAGCVIGNSTVACSHGISTSLVRGGNAVITAIGDGCTDVDPGRHLAVPVRRLSMGISWTRGLSLDSRGFMEFMVGVRLTSISSRPIEGWRL